MNILELIENCEVEWKPLDKVFELKNGYTPSKSVSEYWKNGEIPWFRMEDIRENGRILNSALQKISKSAVKGGRLFPANSIIIATSATIGEHALISIPFLANQRFTNLSLKPDFKDKLDMHFIYYYCFNLCDWCKNNTTMSSFASVDMVGFRKFPIPIPPLEIQQKIVKTLDKFTELEATLEAELGLRKKQYAYYRDKLLTFGDDVEWKSLGEIGELIRGNGLQKKDFTETGVPAIHYGQIYTRYGLSTKDTISFVSHELAKKLRKVDTGDVVITNTSENLSDVGKALVYLGEEQAVTGGHATIFKPNKQLILGKFFAYFTQTNNFATQKQKYAKGTKVIDVSATDMAKIIIPVPPLETQQKIVDILDKFDRLTNSIADGLPREMELRRKQYEHYRERLLNFRKS